VAEILLLAAAAVVSVWIAVIAVAKPRLLLYALIGLAPTQFLFLPIAGVFVSPADVLLCGAALGFLARLAAFGRSTWLALYQHRFLALMIVAYLVGFGLLGVFSRTIVRLPIGMMLSVLACELLRTRQHLRRAAMAVVVAGALDAAWGLFWIARGAPLHPTRFSGMSDVNFSAMLIVAASAVALALVAQSRQRVKLIQPGVLGLAALATLSQMGVLALLSAWVVVLRRVVSRRNQATLLVAGVALVALGLMISPVRQRVITRLMPKPQGDGVARSTTDVRWMIMQTAWDGFAAHPVIGLGYFKFAEFSNTREDIRVTTASAGYPTHNTYLEVLVEGGLVTFGLFMLHWWQFVRRLPRVIRDVARQQDVLVAACIVGFPIMMVCAALANLLLVYSFWAITGLTLACLNVLSKELSTRTV
jgi:O-antigen ligase/polysaccharide polymerase Wzy-like membrane protein